MTDPTPRKPQLILPIPTVYRRPSDTQKGREIVATSGSDVTASSSMIQTDVDAPTTIGAPDQHEPQPIDKQQQQQRETQESPIERELPANAKVVRGDGQGLATGLFCPLCLGDLYQFLVSEKRGFVMCPNRQCAYPFNLPREELQNHFTVAPKIDFGRGGDEGKGKGKGKGV